MDSSFKLTFALYLDVAFDQLSGSVLCISMIGQGFVMQHFVLVLREYTVGTIRNVNGMYA